MLHRNYDFLSLKYYGASVSATYNSYTGQFFIRGRASSTEYNNILAAVHFTTSPRASNWRVIYWTLGDNIFFGDATGHYYSYVSTKGHTSLTWWQAKTSCESMRYFGLSGYLLTVTWWWEQYWVSRIAWYQSGWIGATDYRQANRWRWVTGPEGKQSFYYNSCQSWPIYNFYYYWYLPAWFRNYFSYNIGWGTINGQSFDGAFPYYYWFRWYCFWQHWYQMKCLWEWFEPYKNNWFYQWMFYKWFWYWYSYILNILCTDQTWTNWVYDCRWLCNSYSTVLCVVLWLPQSWQRRHPLLQPQQLGLSGSISELFAQITWHDSIYTRVWYHSVTALCCRIPPLAARK